MALSTVYGPCAVYGHAGSRLRTCCLRTHPLTVHGPGAVYGRAGTRSRICCLRTHQSTVHGLGAVYGRAGYMDGRATYIYIRTRAVYGLISRRSTDRALSTDTQAIWSRSRTFCLRTHLSTVHGPGAVHGRAGTRSRMCCPRTHQSTVHGLGAVCGRAVE